MKLMGHTRAVWGTLMMFWGTTCKDGGRAHTQICAKIRKARTRLESCMSVDATMEIIMTSSLEAAIIDKIDYQ